KQRNNRRSWLQHLHLDGKSWLQTGEDQACNKAGSVTRCVSIIVSVRESPGRRAPKRVRAVRSFGSSLGGRPVVRQKLGNPGNGMIGDARENIFEPDERIDFDALTGSHETPQHRGGLAAFITAKEHPVVAAHCYTADRALGGVVVDWEISILAVAG